MRRKKKGQPYRKTFDNLAKRHLILDPRLTRIALDYSPHGIAPEIQKKLDSLIHLWESGQNAKE